MNVNMVYRYTPVGGMRGIHTRRCTGIRRWRYTGNRLWVVCGYTQVEVYADGGHVGSIRWWRYTDIRLWVVHHMRY